jgi:zinc protease
VFDRMLEEAGAQSNAATWVDWTFYYENLPSGGLELAVRLEADRMANLALDQDQLTQELDVVKNERRLRVDNDPDGVMDERMLASVFPTHPYGMPTIGYMADLEGLTLEDCLGFYRTWYAPSNATVVLVGDVDLRGALALIAQHYGPLPAVARPVSKPAPEAEQTARRDHEMKLPIATEKAKIAWRTVPADHADAYALDVANEVLFTNESSRVYRTLVEDLELASEVDGASEPLALDGLYVVDLVLNEGKAADPAVARVFEALARLAAEGPTEVELARAKNHLEASFLRSLATVGSRATQVGSSELVAGSFRKLFDFVDGIRGVGAGDVKRVVGRYLVESRATVVFGRP